MGKAVLRQIRVLWSGNVETLINRVFSVLESRQNQNFQLKRVLYNNLLTNLACSSHTGEYCPQLFFYGPHCARSVLPRTRANIPQYGPLARLVRSLKLIFIFMMENGIWATFESRNGIKYPLSPPLSGLSYDDTI